MCVMLLFQCIILCPRGHPHCSQSAEVLSPCCCGQRRDGGGGRAVNGHELYASLNLFKLLLCGQFGALQTTTGNGGDRLGM